MPPMSTATTNGLVTIPARPIGAITSTIPGSMDTTQG
jgi:hypothetical protein